MSLLYVATVRTVQQLCVLASNEAEARRVAAESYSSVNPAPEVSDLTRVTELAMLPQGWQDTEPFCDYRVDAEGTCREYLERWQAAERARVAQEAALSRQAQLDLGDCLERRRRMKIMLSEQVEVSMDGKACVAKNSSCKHYRYTEDTNGHRCDLFDATLHEDVDGRPSRCVICLRLGG